jgi:hypothetical protein
MKKIWILLGVVLVLLFLGFREGLEPSEKIKRPSGGLPAYSEQEVNRMIAMIPQSAKDAFEIPAGGNTPTGASTLSKEETIKRIIPGQIAAFYNVKYISATAPITPEVISAFIESRHSNQPAATKELYRAAITAYFITQLTAPDPPPEPPTTPDPPTTPEETTPGTPENPGANTTGGSSTTNWGGGGGNASSRVWGPPFGGTGTPRDLSGGGSDGSGAGYPTLMGPPSDSSAYWAGVGVVPPSKNTLLKGSLPSSASMGSDPMSGFLPYSRQPGDQDLIADPYRVSQSYSSASYSSKNEPVPFLTDFSAFLK